MVKDTMVQVKVDVLAEYSFWLGAKKTFKNMLVIFGPTLIAYLATVPVEWAWLAGGLSYMIKNYLENKDN